MIDILFTFPLDYTDCTASAMGAFCATRTRGVYAYDDNFKVSANGDSILVGEGLAWLKIGKYWGVCFCNDDTAGETIPITFDATVRRRDSVCISYNKLTNVTSLIIRSGDENGLEIAPLPRHDDDYEEIVLASFLNDPANKNVTTVEDLRMDEDYCGLMRDPIEKIPTDTLISEAKERFETLFNSMEHLVLGRGSTAYLTALLARSTAAIHELKLAENQSIPATGTGTLLFENGSSYGAGGNTALFTLEANKELSFSKDCQILIGGQLLLRKTAASNLGSPRLWILMRDANGSEVVTEIQARMEASANIMDTYVLAPKLINYKAGAALVVNVAASMNQPIEIKSLGGSFMNVTVLPDVSDFPKAGDLPIILDSGQVIPELVGGIVPHQIELNDIGSADDIVGVELHIRSAFDDTVGGNLNIKNKTMSRIVFPKEGGDGFTVKPPTQGNWTIKDYIYTVVYLKGIDFYWDDGTLRNDNVFVCTNPIGGTPGPQGLPGPQGAAGDGLVILGVYQTLAALQAAHPTGNKGDSYLVGAASPKNLYVWDMDENAWKDGGAFGTGGGGGVETFNGRAGAVVPAAGDYTAADVGAVPEARKVNGKPLTADVTLNYADVGADAAGRAAAVQSDVNNHKNFAVTSLTGVHGIRYYNNALQVYSNGAWVTNTAESSSPSSEVSRWEMGAPNIQITNQAFSVPVSMFGTAAADASSGAKIAGTGWKLAGNMNFTRAPYSVDSRQAFLLYASGTIILSTNSAGTKEAALKYGAKSVAYDIKDMANSTLGTLTFPRTFLGVFSPGTSEAALSSPEVSVQIFGASADIIRHTGRNMGGTTFTLEAIPI